MTVAAANAVAVASARRSPIREPAPAEPQSMTTVPASATPIATHVRQAHPLAETEPSEESRDERREALDDQRIGHRRA